MSSRGQALSHHRAPLSGRAALVALLALVFALLAFGPVRTYLEQRSRLDRLEDRVAKLVGENDALRAEIEELRDPATIERLARECLGMVPAGEPVVVGTGEPADC